MLGIISLILLRKIFEKNFFNIISFFFIVYFSIIVIYSYTTPILQNDFIVTVDKDLNITPYSVSFESTINHHNFLINYKTSSSPDIKYGDSFKITKYSLESISNNYNNPSSFNYKKYMLIDHITTKIKVTEYEPLYHKFKYSYFFKNLRNRLILNNINKYGANATWINALVFGYKDFNDSLTTNIASSGVSHIFAISGMHIIIVIYLIEFCINLLNISTKYKNYVLIISLIIFCLLSGFNYPIQRAFFVELITILGISRNKATSYAFLLLLLLNPIALFSLSFVLTFSINFALPYIYKLVTFNNKFIKFIASSFLLYFILLPITLNLNYSINFFSPVATIVLTPLVMFFILPISLFLSFIPFLSFLNTFLTYLISLATSIINFISKFSLIVGHFSFFEIYFLVILLIFIFKRRLNLSVYFFFLFLFLFNYNILGSVSVIDIGQGDAILLQEPFNGASILIDTGPPNSSKELISYLSYEGITKLDEVVITHFHNDHYGNYEDVEKKFTIKQLYVPISSTQMPFNTDANITPVRIGDYMQLGNQKVEVLSPYKTSEDKNNESIAFIYNTGKTKWFLGGDMLNDNEKKILQLNYDLNVDYYKVSHHGSNTSSSNDFISALSPKYGIISSGKNNIYNLPSQDTLDILNNNNVIIKDTQNDGLIKFNYLNIIHKGVFP